MICSSSISVPVSFCFCFHSSVSVSVYISLLFYHNYNAFTAITISLCTLLIQHSIPISVSAFVFLLPCDQLFRASCCSYSSVCFLLLYFLPSHSHDHTALSIYNYHDYCHDDYHDDYSCEDDSNDDNYCYRDFENRIILHILTII